MILGELKLPETPIFLGPMAGVTDLPFRLICRRYGADVVCTEMVSAKAMFYKNRGTEALLWTEDESPIAVQLFGNDPELMADMAQTVEERFDIIDINMGCPVAKIVKNHEGSYLMREPKLAERIIAAVAGRVKKPLTVKIRKGFDDEHVNAVEFAKMAEGAGAAAVAIHARTREQFYSGRADWSVIRDVKQAVSIPVIGNGDVINGETALAMREMTGADGIMIARAARGNPWIFREIRAALDGKEIPADPLDEEVLAVVLEHADGLAREKGEWLAVREMRKHLGWYSAGRRDAALFRGMVCRIETLEDLKKTTEEFFL